MNFSSETLAVEVDAAAVVYVPNFKFDVCNFSLEFQFQSFLEHSFQVGQQ